MKTGRPTISDAEKARRGTLDKRWSEDARTERAEQKVVALFGQDNLATVPEPPVGLSERAVEEYRLWARRLLEVGKLSSIWVDKVTLYAIRKHSIEARLASGKPPKDGDVRGAEMFLKEISALNVDVPRAGQEAPKSKWQPIGRLSANAKRPGGR
jgi:hypothetical protein